MSSYRFGGRVLLGISLVASSWVLACERQETKPAAGVAGGLHAALVPTLSVNDYNQFVSVTMLAIAMIGGIQSLFGAALAGLAFIALPQLLKDLGLSLTGSRFDLVLGIGLLVVVVSRPQGLASMLPAQWRQR